MASPIPRPPSATVQVSAALHEKVKDLREQFRGYSAPVVRNLDDRSLFVGAGADANLPARVGVLRGVSDDVADALDQARPVASHKEGTMVPDFGELVMPLLNQRLSSLDALRDDIRKIDRRGLEGNASLCNPSNIQQVIYLPHQLPGLPSNDTYRRHSTRLRHRELREQLSGGMNRGKRISELVPEGREKFVLEPLLIANTRLELLAPTDIACDFRGPDHLPFLILDRGYGERHIDALSVLPEAHRIEVLDTLATSETREDVLFFGFELWRNDRHDRPADDLARRIPIEALGRRIPRGDRAIDGLADDGIIR